MWRYISLVEKVVVLCLLSESIIVRVSNIFRVYI